MSIARTVEDVRRLAPKRGWYWLLGLGDARWQCAQLSTYAGRRTWFVHGNEWGDENLADSASRIIGPITPPGAEEDTHG